MTTADSTTVRADETEDLADGFQFTDDASNALTRRVKGRIAALGSVGIDSGSSSPLIRRLSTKLIRRQV